MGFCNLENRLSGGGWECIKPVTRTPYCRPICGDGKIVGNEACENPSTQDGCMNVDGVCTVVPGWDCANEFECT